MKYQAVTAILEEMRKEKAKIHFGGRGKKAAHEARKQTEKNVEKKTDSYTEVLRTHGLLV